MVTAGLQTDHNTSLVTYRLSLGCFHCQDVSVGGGRVSDRKFARSRERVNLGTKPLVLKRGTPATINCASLNVMLTML